MKIKDGYILKRLLGSYMIFSIDDASDSGKVHTLNETGAFLWTELSGGAERDRLIKALTDEYDVDAGTAAQDVDNFLSHLESLGILIK